MSVTAVLAPAARRTGALAVPSLAVPAALYLVAFAVRVVAAAIVSFPLNEGSAYYVEVARNIVAGRGPVIDSIWSYATPPLTLPRPAFELWQPLASVIAAWPMIILGPSFASAQLGFAAVGALLAPLAWLVARDAAKRLDLPDNRQRWVAVGAGAVAAVAGPFVLSAAIPDSTLPFTVLVVASALAIPRAARGERGAIVALGLLFGLAYMTRMEAVYLGVVFVAFTWQAGARGSALAGRVGAVALIGGLVALPWWWRNAAVFGTPLPGQISDNVFLTANYQIFNFGSRPSLDGFLGQGVPTIAFNIAAAAWHDAVDVLLVPGNVIVALGLIAAVLGWRRRAAMSGSPLAVLLTYGAFTFAIIALAFPVATLWGTFEHASGALMVAFAVLAVLAGDAFVARIRAWRHWPRPNAGMAPAAIVAVAVAMTALQLTLAGARAISRQHQLDAVAAVVRDNGVADGSAPLVTDRPLWLGTALGSATLVLPQQSLSAVLGVMHEFGARYVVLVDGLPAGPAFVDGTQALPSNCLQQLPITPPAAAPGLVVLEADGLCT